MLETIANPGIAGCLAALLVAIGIEVEEAALGHALDALGGVIAAIGIVAGFIRARRAAAHL